MVLKQAAESDLGWWLLGVHRSPYSTSVPRRYDTHADKKYARKFARYIKKIPKGKIVMVAVRDAAKNQVRIANTRAHASRQSGIVGMYSSIADF